MRDLLSVSLKQKTLWKLPNHTPFKYHQFDVFYSLNLIIVLHLAHFVALVHYYNKVYLELIQVGRFSSASYQVNPVFCLFTRLEHHLALFRP